MFLVLSPTLGFAQVTVEQALKLTPVQKSDVEFSIPEPDEIKNCTIESVKKSGISGWIVRDPAGRLLRRFLDTDGDKNIDLWCYYRDGFEVYRDIDSNFDRNADQYRWFSSQGTRWGIDKNQDGEIDAWKRISAEEVSEEFAKAIVQGDIKRFTRLLMRDSELARVGFDGDRRKLIGESLEKSRVGFEQLAKSQRSSLSGARWIQFGGLRPGLIPEGTEGASQDIIIYENVATLLRSGSTNIQIGLGTLVQVGDCWRMIDSPQLISEKSPTSFASWYRSVESADVEAIRTPGDSAMQNLLEKFQALDKQLATAKSSAEKKKIYAGMADTVSELALKSESEEDSINWTRQFADTLTAAIQSGEYPDGLARLEEFANQLEKAGKGTQGVALVKYRLINARFGVELNDPKTNIAEAQANWLDELESFVKEYPDDANVPDAMMQLAMADEFEGEKEKAEKWYQSIATQFSESEFAAKAKGAIRRLNSIGKTMALKGQTVNGDPFDIADLKGKIVLVHYWADWCEICKKEFDTLAEIRKKYPDLKLVGVNCDNEPDTAVASVRRTGIGWPQLHSQGGYNDGFAAEMGIVSLPSMILIDQNGRIVSTTLSINSVEREIKSLVK